MPAAIASLQQILDWRVEEIAATLRELTAYIEGEARRIGLDPVPGERRVGHLIGLRSQKPFPADLGKRLAAENIYVSQRGNSIRVSPHLYNTREECARLVAALARIL